MNPHEQYLEVSINVRQRDRAKGTIYNVRNIKHGKIVGETFTTHQIIGGYYAPAERRNVAVRLSKQHVLRSEMEQVTALDTGNTFVMKAKPPFNDHYMILGGPITRADLLKLAQYVIHEVATDEEVKDLGIDKW